jgi:hypothetical protein
MLMWAMCVRDLGLFARDSDKYVAEYGKRLGEGEGARESTNFEGEGEPEEGAVKGRERTDEG